MKTKSNIKLAESFRVDAGDILLAKSFSIEEDYKRSVILLLDHDEAGSTGIILNKVSNLIVNDAIPQLDLLHPLYYGGSHSMELVYCVHNFANLPGVRALGNGLYFGADPLCLEGVIHSNILNSTCVRFCFGFVQWAPGELEDEIFDNKWWKGKISAEELFTMPFQNLWSYELIKSGHLYGIFNDYSDPIMN